jgi:AAA+ ATPase superfamily predicted ATPase
VEVYTVLGGVPRYLEEFDDSFDIMSFLELGETGHVMEEMKKTFNAFIGLAFEEIAAEFLSNNYRVGKWWYKETEIDLVGLRKGEVAFFEVKWRNMGKGNIKKQSP